MKYRSIALSGQIASGTTTAAQTLAKKYNLEFHYAGDIFRKYMQVHNIPLYDKAQIPDDMDQKIDREMTDLAASEKKVIIDGHYIAYFTKDMPHVLRVLFICDEEERSRRAASRKQEKESTEEIKRREAGLDAKFRKLYANEYYLDPKFFNFTVDTTFTTPQEVVDLISEKFEED